MIFYFSGTGNSRFVADYLSEQLEDECFSIGDIVKNKLPRRFYSQKPYILVAPIYAWRLPRMVENFIMRSNFQGNKNFYVVATMGKNSGSCATYTRKIVDSVGLTYRGFCGIVMPNNYVRNSNMPTEEEAITIIKNSLPRMAEVARDIKIGDPITNKRVHFAGWLLSGSVNKGFNQFMLKSQQITVENSCVGCGTCADACPTGNIEIKNNRPVFGDRCTSCYACLHHCPEAALGVGKNSQKRGQYRCPTYADFKEAYLNG